MSDSQTSEPGTERTLRSTVRNPRRRPRQSDADSLKSAPRRKRSKISEDTFLPPRTEEHANGASEVLALNGDLHHAQSSGRDRGRSRKASVPMMDVEIPLREKKHSVKRPVRGDGATVLTQNSRYSVRLLPSTPKELRREGVEYRGSLGAAHLALGVTRERAYIWDYTSHTPASNMRVFDIPFSSPSTEPLPFGALITSGTSTDVGLVLVSAAGKVVYHESVERAASLGLFQDRNTGVHGSLGSLFSGESVTDIVSADHAGFILILSSGRIAQLTLRDAQGKARVFTQFLRSTQESSGGLFGGIKGILGGGSWKRDVTAVHTRPLGTRGRMQAIALTERAEMQIWDLDWSGRYSFRSTVDFRELLIHELKNVDLPELQGQSETVSALDFAILEKPSTSSDVTVLGAELPIDLSVLLKSGTPDRHTYLVAEISIEGEDVRVAQMLTLDTYRSRSTRAPHSQPRFLLPKPKHTSFVIFEDAVVLMGTTEIEGSSPEAQLHASYLQPAAFEDSLYVRKDRDIAILSACEEDARGGQESVIAFVKSAGLVRISVSDPVSTALESRIPIKTKIQQAVFHGDLQDDNILDFSRAGSDKYSSGEVEEAALTISDEILRSTSPFISTSPTSMEAHFTYKIQALRALVSHVRRSYPVLSKATCWRLLWDAEKVAAGQRMWRLFEEHVAAASQKKRTATVMDELCCTVQQGLDPNSDEVPSDSDSVRTFFVHSLHRVERLLPMARIFLADVRTRTDLDSKRKLRLVIEAGDIWNRTMETVLTLRADSASAYGILPGFIEDGLLTDVAEYAELPEFWTSTESMLKAIAQMCEISRNFAEEEWAKNEQNPEIAATLEPLVASIGEENPKLIQQMCNVYQERINWLASRSTERDRQLAEMLRTNYNSTRNDQFRALAAIAQPAAGMRLAEKYRDMGTLTEMIVAEMQYSVEQLQETGNDGVAEGILEYIEGLRVRIGKYFDRFGDDWANAYFDEGFSGGKGGVMLREAQEHWQAALTDYLRAEPDRARICWINDITADKDFGHASESLAVVAKDQETRIWSKKVELSMAKLALLATQEKPTENSKGRSEHEVLAETPAHDLELIDIQEQLYYHMLPEIQHLIDRQAESDAVVQKFALKNQDLHALKQLLETNLNRILDREVLSVDELIDTLTLMDSVQNDWAEGQNVEGAECFLALRALNAVANDMPQDRFETVLQLIWKRCYLYDDWVEIDDDREQSEEETSATLRSTTLWRTLWMAHVQDFFSLPDCHVRHLLPSECLGAGCLPEHLMYRWSHPDLLDPILHDNKIQDEQLQGYVTDRRLDQWIEACVDDVKKTMDLQAEEHAQQLQVERNFEAAAHETKTKRGKSNGHAKRPNGLEAEDYGDQDSFVGADEDVEMA